MFLNVVDSIYPPCCAICGNILNNKDVYACSSCIRKTKYVGRIRCMKCGRKLSDETVEYCLDCKKTEHIFDRNLAVWEYDDSIKKSMYAFKYSNIRENGKFYADEIARIYGDIISGYNADVIIPVPLFEKKLRTRGYNQSEIIARELGKIIDIPVDSEILIRTRDTRPQKELNDQERRNNLKNAFQVTKNVVEYKKIILLDDIYTTGATMDECSAALKRAGVEHIYPVCVCIGKGY